MLHNLKFFSLCLVVFLLFSCSKDSEDNDGNLRFTFGITSQFNDKNSEIEAIKFAYNDAYKLYGLKFSYDVFAKETKKEDILKACKDAEDAIMTSSIKFDGCYTYEVRYNQKSVYHKIYGTR